MKIYTIYQVLTEYVNDVIPYFLKLGVSVKSDSYLTRFVFEQNSNHINELASKLQKESKTYIVYNFTEFLDIELDSAQWLTMSSRVIIGFPQPENDDDGYLHASYDLTNYCDKCGLGKFQNAPIRMQKEPKWNRWQIFSLNWIFDEFYVQKQTWEDVFRPFGVDFTPVLKHKTGEVLETVVQLKIDTTLDTELDLRSQSYETCAVCNRKKYVPNFDGFFPTFLSSTNLKKHMMRSQESFGFGLEARNIIFISHELYQAIKVHKLVGAEYAAVERLHE